MWVYYAGSQGLLVGVDKLQPTYLKATPLLLSDYSRIRDTIAWEQSMMALLSYVTKMFALRYEPIAKGLEAEEENFLRYDSPKSKPLSALPWIISTLAFAALSAILWLRSHPHSSVGAYEIGFRTELGVLGRHPCARCRVEFRTTADNY